jgi:2-polyprenyl-3-methyl-5-hydroxy-6-metoxy-1,4-benzoquinol methylase
MQKPEGYFSEEREEMGSFIPAGVGTLLDVGCGEGGFSGGLIKERGITAWGIEPDKNSAKKAGKKLRRVINSDFFGALNRLPDKHFDCAVFNDVLEHMYDPVSALTLIKKKLKENGVVVCSIPNVLHFSVLKRLLFKKDWKYEPFGVLDETHIRFFTKKSIIRMFESLDYEIITIKGINAHISIKNMAFLIATLGYFLDSRYLQYAVVARKKNKS